MRFGILELLVLPGLTAGLLGFLLPFALRPLLHRWNLVDLPTQRSSHSQPTFRGMGLATASAASFAFALALLLGIIHTDRSVALAVLCGMLGSAALGWMEDFRGVSIKVRLAVQLLLAFGVTTAISLNLQTSPWWIPLGVFAITAYINVVNFMDGINGISGLHGLVVGSFYAYAGWVNAMPWLVVGGISLALAYLAFLPWNVRPGKNVFLGDAGSYFLGGAAASMAVGAFLSGIYVEYILSPLMVYLVDTGFTLLRRIIKGEQWYKPHRSHIYQQLTDLGFSHTASALLVAAISVLISLITISALPYETQNALWAGILVLLILLAYLALPSILLKVKRARR